MNTSHLNRRTLLGAAAALGASALPAMAQPLAPGQEKFRALFKEMVETKTALSNGSCTELAQKVAPIPGAETTVALRKLLEAKDCAVRAVVAALKSRPVGPNGE